MHILSPISNATNSYLVIEEMKQAGMSPAVIRMNEMMINSYFELEGIFCQPPKNSWQSIMRMSWQLALAFMRHKKRELKERLENMPPDEVLSLTAKDIDEIVIKDNMIQQTTVQIEESQDIPLLGNLEAREDAEDQLEALEELQREELAEYREQLAV